MNETVTWIMANMHRAMDNGQKDVVVSIEDLKELIAVVASSEARAKIEYAGKPLGFAKAERVRQLLTSERKKITVCLYKTAEYDTPVSFTDLPPKGLPAQDN